MRDLTQMEVRTMRVLCISFLLAAGCASSPKVAQVAAPHEPPRPPAVARTVDVELTDTTASGAKTAHYTLAIVDDFGWSELSARSATENLRLKARSNRMHGEYPTIVSVELRRDAQGAPDVFLTQSTIFFAGRRTVLGHVERDGGSTDVAMVTR